jgi:hypothetical protein
VRNFSEVDDVMHAFHHVLLPRFDLEQLHPTTRRRHGHNPCTFVSAPSTRSPTFSRRKGTENEVRDRPWLQGSARPARGPARPLATYPTRFRLDGSKTDEPVDDIARDHARRDIANNHERKVAREAQAAARKEPAAEKPAAREESIPKPEPPKAACPPELIEGLNLEEEEDRIRFRLRVVFRHFERMAPDVA